MKVVYKVQHKEGKEMTREELIRYGKDYLNDLENYCCKISNNKHMEFVRKSIKALEQEPILDKIRAEIEQNAYPIVHGVNNHELGMTLYGILQIIDKYKTENEDNMTDIKNLIIETANRRDLTFAQNFNGRAYALMDVNWIGYFDTLDEVLEFLDISVEIDKTESEE